MTSQSFRSRRIQHSVFLAASSAIEQLEPRQLFSIGLGPAVGTALSAVPVGDPAAPIIADFDNDTINDVIIAYPSPSAVEPGFIQFGKNDGAGNFTFSTEVNVGVFSGRPVVGDFNGDGNKDLAVTNAFSGQVLVLAGNGDGTFAPAATFAAQTSPEPLAVADFNADTFDDLVVGNRSSNTVQVFPGDAVALLGASNATITTGTDPASLSIGDFTGDGNTDILVGASGGIGAAAGQLQVFPGNGDGTFVLTPVTTSGPFGVSSTPDINSDGIPDVVVGVSTIDRADVLLNNGDGTFRLAKGSTGKSAFGQPVAADLDNNLKADLLTATAGEIEVLPGIGDGTFGKVQRFNAGAGSGPAVGDLNGDGRPDVLTINDTPGVQAGRILNLSPGLILGPDFSIQITSGLAPNILNNSSQRVTVQVTNNGNEAFKGEVPLQIYFSTDTTIDEGDSLIHQVFPKLKLGIGQSKSVKLKFQVTADPAAYNLFARVDPFGTTGDLNLANNDSTPQAVTVADPFIDLVAGTIVVPAGPLAVGTKTRVDLPVTNNGNITASGKVQFLVVASTDNVPEAGLDPVVATVNARIKLKPTGAKTISFKFKIPSLLSPGDYFFIGLANTNGGVDETDFDNNTSPSAAPITITA